MPILKLLLLQGGEIVKRVMLFYTLSGIIGAAVIWSVIEAWMLVATLIVRFAWRVFKFVLLLMLVYIAVIMYCCL
jgi:energy-coupling factor transporter transmembrane protein EcfT